MTNEPTCTPLASAWALLEKKGWLSRRRPSARKRLLSIARLRDFDAGSSIYRAGDKPDGIYALCSGDIEVAIPRADGQDCLFHRAEVGFWVGDLAMFSGQTRLVSLRAASPCRLVHLPQIALEKLIGRNVELVKDFYELSHENTRLILQLLGNLAVGNADHRIALRLLMLAETQSDNRDWIQMSQDTLAQMVALSPKTVRRTLKHLQDGGLIDVSYRKIRIADRDRLARAFGYALAG